MKVRGGKETGATGAVRPTKSAGAVSPAAPAAPADPVSIAGLTDAELTPRVRAALAQLMEEVASLRAELGATRARMQQLSALADTDPLVGILNRRAFVSELERALALGERHGQPASLVFIDVNEMKQINDRHGHAAGDAALTHVAKVIGENIRQTDILARIGGDEFALILNYAPHADAVAKVAALAEALIAAPLAFDGASIAVSISGGVAELKGGKTAEAAMKEADGAMYVGKGRR